MGMSTHVMGFKPPDGKWRSMKAVYDSCIGAGIRIPKEVEEFFNYENPGNSGVAVSEEQLGGAVREYHEREKQGYEILIDKLPPDVKIVRVYNSY